MRERREKSMYFLSTVAEATANTELVNTEALLSGGKYRVRFLWATDHTLFCDQYVTLCSVCFALKTYLRSITDVVTLNSQPTL